MRIGQGYDVHRLVKGRRLILGGVEIPHKTGLLGHSDADVLLHAITDAILGALGCGDLGKYFPDSSAEFKDIDSRLLLRRAMTIGTKKGYHLANMDATVIAQEPKLAPYIDSMRANIASDCGCSVAEVNVKATTTEKLGFEGREDGIAAMAVVLLEKN